jgi:hypothetical protein
MKSWIQAKILGLGNPLASRFVRLSMHNLDTIRFVTHENWIKKGTENETLHGNAHAEIR